jgi:predicted dehydrogenase
MVRAALVGLRGFGAVHLAELDRLAGLGKLELVGCADTVQPPPAAADVLARLGSAVYERYDDLLDATRPDLVVVATPPHLHAEMAASALRTGSHVLLEKPPVVDMAEMRVLEDLLSATGLVCQVGFQSLGSGACRRLGELCRAAAFGSELRVSASGHWQRDSAYWERSPWAGRDTLDGRAVHDGALTNPFAHAVMSCLAILGWESLDAFDEVAVERYRANPIEVDDTSVVRVRHGGAEIVVAVTLCAETTSEPRCTVRGSRGSATWAYTGDEVAIELDGSRPVVESHSRVTLLEELVDVLSRTAGVLPGDVELSCPLARTRGFVRLVEAIAATPVRAIAPSRTAVRRDPTTTVTTTVVVGVDAMVDAAASRGVLLSDLGL